MRQASERRSLMVVLGALMLGMLISSLDQTIVATALPTIAGDLGGLSHLSWVVTAYLIATTASTPIYGKLGDQYGRKIVYQASIVIFLLGSALAGLSHSMDQLIAFRGLQGIGGGGLMVTAQAIIGDVVPPLERGRYQGYFGAVFGVSSVVGPLLGGFLVDTLSWRWVFYINLPIGAAALAATAAALHVPADRSRHQIDYLGTVLLATAVTGIVLLTTWGGTQYPWTSAPILALGAGSLALLGLFVRVEARAAEPVLPLRLFRGAVFNVASAIGFIVGFAMFGAITFLPLFLQVVNGASPTASGLQLLPMMAGLLFASVGSGQLMSRWGRYKPFPIAGTAVTAIFLYLLSTMGPHTALATRSWYMAGLGLGLGLVMQVLVVAVQNSVDYEDLGAGTAAASFFRSVGSAFGVAVFGAVFYGQLAARLAANLPAGLPPGTTAAALQSNPAALRALPAGLRAVFIASFGQALDHVFLTAVPVAVAAFALTWLLREIPLRATSRAAGLGEHFAMPKLSDPLPEIERALATLVRRADDSLPWRARLAEQVGLAIDPAAYRLLDEIRTRGPVTLGDLAARLERAPDDVAPFASSLEAAGLVARDGGGTGPEPLLVPTGKGLSALDTWVSVRRESLLRLVQGWSPERHAEVGEVLERLAREMAAHDGEVAPAGPRR